MFWLQTQSGHVLLTLPSVSTKCRQGCQVKVLVSVPRRPESWPCPGAASGVPYSKVFDCRAPYMAVMKTKLDVEQVSFGRGAVRFLLRCALSRRMWSPIGHAGPSSKSQLPTIRWSSTMSVANLGRQLSVRCLARYSGMCPLQVVLETELEVKQVVPSTVQEKLAVVCKS
jgi:hypothetical protein